jgi:hypothetical protein
MQVGRCSEIKLEKEEVYINIEELSFHSRSTGKKV